jgi:hypothetical protein
MTPAANPKKESITLSLVWCGFKKRNGNAPSEVAIPAIVL